MPQQDWSGARTAQPKAKAIGKAARLHAAPGTQAPAPETERQASSDNNAGPGVALVSKGRASAGQAGGKQPAKKPAARQSLMERVRSVAPAWMASSGAADSGNQVVLRGRKTGATTTPQPKSDHKARVKRKLEKKKRERTTSGRIIVKEEDRMTVLLKYYPLLVAAHWFGARRFDHVGDGEFDVEDLDDLVEDPGKHLHLCMTRPEPLHVTRKKEKDIEKRKLKKLTARHKKLGQIEAEHQEGIVHHVLQKMQIDVHSFEEGLMDWDSEDDDEDELVRDYYKQHLPVCTFIQVCVIIGLWVGYAVQSHPYSFTKYGIAFDQEHALAKYPNNEKSLFGCMRACSEESRCAGFSYLWSYNSSCYLLDAMGGTTNTAYQLFAQYEKGSVSLSSLLTQKAGLESAFPGDTALMAPSFCESGLAGGYSIELWRLLSYQFSHQGLIHLGTNVFVLIVMGIPLEGAHGHSWLFWLYTAGVFGGGLLWLLWDAHELTMGTSAGCMALVGLQLGDFWLNWGDKKLKWTEVCIVTFLLLLQVTSYGVGVDFSLTSHCTLFGGLLVGFFFGVTFGTNFKETTCERFLRIAMSLFLFIATFGIILYWLVALNHPATSAIWSSESYCWRGQVCIPPEYGGSCTSSADYQCAQCDTRDCVLSWFPKGNTFLPSPPDEEFCDKRGYRKDDVAPAFVGE